MKEMDRLRKEINGLLTEGMSNVYLKVLLLSKTDAFKT